MNRIERLGRKATWPVAFALAAFIVAGCGSGSDDPGATTTPTPTPVVVDPVGAACVGADCVPLGTAGNYVILALSGVTNVPTSVITGHIGSASSSGNTTGFSEVMDASNTFATSAQVTGRMYAFDYAEPTPTELTTATATDATAAFAAADAKSSTNTNVGGGDLTGLDLAPGVYDWTTGVQVNTASAVTLTGSATDVWVFQIAGDITMNPGARVTLAGGALPQNVFWRTAGVAALNTTAHIEGIVLSGSSITLATGATAKGRLIASSAVTLDANTVTRP